MCFWNLELVCEEGYVEQLGFLVMSMLCLSYVKLFQYFMMRNCDTY